jgi:phage tail sheath gpL-like
MSGSVVPLSIPGNLRVPLFYAQFDNSKAGVNQQNTYALILGQATTAVPAVVDYVPSPAAAAQMFGANSQLAAEIAAYMANDPVTPVYAVPYVDAGGGVAATGAYAFGGTATKAGTVSAYVGDQLVQVAVAVGDTAATIATNLTAAINAYVYSIGGGAQQSALQLPVTAVAAAGTVNLTADNKGTLGNAIPLGLNLRGTLGGESTPAGITVAITAMSGGAGDPSLATLPAILGNQGFDFICNPWETTTQYAFTATLMNDAAGRWSYSNALYGHIFSAKADTVTNLLALGGALNDQHLAIFGVAAGAGGVATPGYVVAAAVTAACAVQLQAMPNRPLQTVTVQGIMGEQPGAAFSFSQEQALLTTGIAVLRGNPDGSVQIVRAVTTYQTNSYGQSDQSYLDTETMFSLMAFTRRLKARITQEFPRALLVQDGTKVGFGVPAISPSIAKGVLVAEYAAMEMEGLVQNTDAFEAGLVVDINADDPSRLDVLVDPYFVSGLRIFATLVQFHLNTQAAA